MILTRTADTVTVRCPAKVNLFLETRGLRPDGYHEIETVMQAVTLYDDVAIERRAGEGVAFSCSDPRLPAGSENLAYRAAELYLREASLPGSVSVALEKRLPAGAGLGGGSSDAAGVLAGLNELAGGKLARERLRRLAAQLGSDVAFFLYGGTALCRGRGEKVAPVRAGLTGHYVIYCPPRVLSTRSVYENARKLGLTSGNRDASVILESLAQGAYVSVCANLFNRLEEAAVSLAPDVERARQALAQAAGRAAFVSGSGAAVYVLLESASRATEVAGRLRGRAPGQVFVAQTERGAASEA